MKYRVLSLIVSAVTLMSAPSFKVGVTYNTNDNTVSQSGLILNSASGSYTNADVNGVINVKGASSGVTGLGVADDTTALQVRANLAKNKKLVFTAGDYKFSDLALPDGCEVVFEGGVNLISASPGVVSYWFTVTSKTNVTIHGKVNANGNAEITGLVHFISSPNCSVYDVTVYNLATNTFSLGGGAISGVSSPRLYVNNCTIDGAGYGVALDGCDRSIVTGNKIKNTYRDGILVYDYSNNSTVMANVIEKYSSGLQSGRGGIQVYGTFNTVVSGNIILDAYASNPQDTGGIRFRDAANFSCVGNMVTNAPSGILCNQASDFPGITCYGTITGNSVDRCVFSDIHVAGNCGYVGVHDNITANANTAASASVASITIASPYAAISGNIISNNIGNAWGIYGGSTGLLINDNNLINVGNGGSSVPQIAAFGTNIAVYNNHFKDDRATSIGYLGIKIYTNCSASIGYNFYGNGITNFIEVNSNATYFANSAPFLNRFATTPTTGTFPVGTLSKGSGGRMFRSNGSGWSEDVFMDSIYANNSSLNFYAADGTTSVSVLSLTSGNNTVISTPAAGGSLILNSTAAKVQIQTSGGYWYLYPNGDMRSGVIGAPTYTTSSSEGGLLRTTNINGKVMLVATWPTLPYSVLATEGVGNPISTNDYGSTWTTNYQQSASQSNIWKKIETIVAGAAGTNQSVLVNGSLVQGPNFTNSASGKFTTGSTTNIFIESDLVVNVRDITYGALANGSDDSTAINAAATAASGKILWLDDGNYTVNSSISIGSNVRVAGPGKLVAGAAMTNSHVVELRGTNIFVDALTIDGNNSALRGLAIRTNSSDVYIKNLVVRNVGQFGGAVSQPAGVRIEGAVTNINISDFLIDGVNAANNGDGVGLYIAGFASSTVPRGVTFKHGKVRNVIPVTDGDGFRFQNDWTEKGDITLDDILFENCAKRGIKIMTPGVKVVNCVIINPGYTGISIYAGDTTIINNTVRDSTGDNCIEIGSNVTSITNVYVAFNTVNMATNADITTTGDGIRVTGTNVNNVSITQNQITHGRVGIYLTGGINNATITDNIIEGIKTSGVISTLSSVSAVDYYPNTLTIKGNQFKSVTNTPISVIGGSNVKVFLNQLYGTGTVAVFTTVTNGFKSFNTSDSDKGLDSTQFDVSLSSGQFVIKDGAVLTNTQFTSIGVDRAAAGAGSPFYAQKAVNFGYNMVMENTSNGINANAAYVLQNDLTNNFSMGIGGSLYDTLTNKAFFTMSTGLVGTVFKTALTGQYYYFDNAGTEVARVDSGGIIANRRVRFTPAAGDISSPANGDIWYNSTSGKFRKQEGGATSDLDTTGGGGSAPVGTMVNSGASIVGSVPGAADLTGTNLIPSKITAIGTNLLTGTLGVTNRATFNGEVLIPGMPTLTIATDTIDVTGYSKALIETEAAASSDNLSTINGGVAGKLFWFLNTLNSRTITWKHNVGNIITSSSADFTTSSGELVVGLYLEGHNKWYIWPTKALAQIGTIALTQGGTGQTTAPAAFDALSQAAEVSIASASTVNIGAAASARILITGTTGITAFDTVVAGTLRFIRFNGILTITHNATSMILPNATSNITTASGDTCIAISLGSGNWRIYAYQKANGQALVDNTGGAGGTVGTVINSGTPLDLAVPTYTGTTGTNVIPSKITITALTNLNVGSIVITNGASYGDPATTNFATITFAYGANYTNASTANGITNNIPVVFSSNVVANATLNATTLQQGGVGVVTTARTVTIAGTANEITSSAGAQDLSANRTWTLSLPTALTFTGKTVTGGTFSGPSITDGVATSSFQLPNSAAPTTDAFGEIAGDNNFWAASHGALQYFDGTSNMVVVATAITSIPSDGQVPTWDNTLKVWKAVTPTTGGAIVGTMLNVGASLANAVPIYNDTTGTNIVPAKVTIGSLTNLLTGGLVVSNSAAQITVNGQVFTYPAGPDTLVGNTNAATLQNKTTTTTSAGGNNTITARRYLPLKFEKVALTSMVVNTNDFSTAGYGRVRFTGNSTATNSNFMVYRAIVPPRFVGGSGQDLTMEYMSVKTSGTQTGAITFNIGLRDTTDSAAADATDATSFNTYVALTSAALSTPAASDRFSIANKTLTGWRSALTAGHDVEICIARNDTNTDTMDVIDMLISYVETQ